MANQACSITIGFICVHTALFLAIISLNSTHLVTTCDNEVGASNYSNPSTTQIFWHVCTCEGCSLLNDNMGLKYSHIMFTAGTGLLTLVTLGMYCYLVLGCLSSSVVISVIHTIKLLLTCGCLLASQILFDLYRVPVTSTHAITNKITWPFYVSLGVTVMTTVAMLAALERTRVVCVQQKEAYSDLDKK